MEMLDESPFLEVPQITINICPFEAAEPVVKQIYWMLDQFRTRYRFDYSYVTHSDCNMVRERGIRQPMLEVYLQSKPDSSGNFRAGPYIWEARCPLEGECVVAKEEWIDYRHHTSAPISGPGGLYAPGQVSQP